MNWFLYYLDLRHERAHESFSIVNLNVNLTTLLCIRLLFGNFGCMFYNLSEATLSGDSYLGLQKEVTA